MATTEEMKIYAVTGTFHGSIIEAMTEGEARTAFHTVYNGESIINIKILSNKHRLSNL